VADHADLGSARASYDARSWVAAYESFAGAESLSADDLEQFATSAYMLGRDEEYFALLERAHHQHAEAGELLAAARCARWIGHQRMFRGDVGQGTGWQARAQRLVETDGSDCAEKGYLLFSRMFHAIISGDLETALTASREATAVGRRFADPDLTALGGHTSGLLLIDLGRVAEGLALLDEAMVAVTTGELSPIVNGIVYCGVITGCRAAYDVRRAQEWTSAMTRWCDQQTGLVNFHGVCQVHRAQIMQLHGSWPEALGEVVRIAATSSDPSALGEAAYLAGELHRLQGRFDAAEEAYRSASGYGCEPQPGLSLLRLAQGSVQAAVTMVQRARGEVTSPALRVALLPAAVEILLAAEELELAAAACQELEQLAGQYGSVLLAATTQQAVGICRLAAGDPEEALAVLRAAARSWQDLGAPYEAAKARGMVAQACRALGDEESAELELDAAHAALARLGAVPDLARLDAQRPSRRGEGLSPREIEVLRLVAAGATNRAIAAELVLSERTVDRHVSNILTKLDVTSRTAAATYAHERALL
jgi:DNA-binding NarL/FixJ family response regulator